MDKLKRRECKLTDYNFVLELVKESIFPLVAVYFKPDENIFKKRFEEDYKERTILTDNEKPVGFYQINKLGEKMEIKGLFLIKEYRGKGIG